MSPFFIRFSGLTLNEILDELENDLPEDLQQAHYININLIPEDSANNEVTDEDSGAEENVDFANLPPALLTGAAEIKTNLFDSDSDSEYDIPISQILKKNLRNKKKRF